MIFKVDEWMDGFSPTFRKWFHRLHEGMRGRKVQMPKAIRIFHRAFSEFFNMDDWQVSKRLINDSLVNEGSNTQSERNHILLEPWHY